MAFQLRYKETVQSEIDGFPDQLRRKWTLRTGDLIQNPFPRVGDGFEILEVTNDFGDKFLSLVDDGLTFTAQFDVYTWPAAEENSFGYEGIVHVWNLVA